jgi:hypothetical protein
MSSQAGPVGIFCPRCDKAGTPSRLVRQMAAKQEGMLVRCPACSAVYNYQSLMATHPRMDKPDFVEKQPAGTQSIPLWLHPEVILALQKKWPNYLTTLHSAVTALADPDSVLIEGLHAREMAAIGVKTGRQVLGMAKRLKELEEEVAGLKLRENTLRQFFSSMGMAMPQVAQPAATTNQPVNEMPSQPPMDANGNLLTPPRAQFSQLQDDGSGLLVPSDGQPAEPASQFSFPSGAAPVADTRPAFVTSNLNLR